MPDQPTMSEKHPVAIVLRCDWCGKPRTVPSTEDLAAGWLAWLVANRRREVLEALNNDSRIRVVEVSTELIGELSDWSEPVQMIWQDGTLVLRLWRRSIVRRVLDALLRNPSHVGGNAAGGDDE